MKIKKQASKNTTPFSNIFSASFCTVSSYSAVPLNFLVSCKHKNIKVVHYTLKYFLNSAENYLIMRDIITLAFTQD